MIVSQFEVNLWRSNMFIWRRQWHPTPVLLPGKSHGWRSLVGCSPWGRWESDTTERLHFSLFIFMHWRRKWQPTPVFLPGESQRWGSLVGCRLWVAQSRTRLKRLSSSSSNMFITGNITIWLSSVWLGIFKHYFMSLKVSLLYSHSSHTFLVKVF